MTWIAQRLPQQVELGAIRRDMEDIEIVTTDGGWEVRNARHSQSLREFDISFPPAERDDAVYAAVVAQYKAARGQLHTWPLRDWSDYAVTAEPFGTGDNSETAFQLIKSWTVGSETHSRNITRPVSAISVYLDDVLQGSGYTVDYDTGIVTFDTPPGVGVALTWTGEFDTPVRFDSPLRSSALTGWLEHIETITVKEVRE